MFGCHQLLEELRLLDRRLVVATAERLDDVGEAQLAFHCAAARGIEEVLDAAGSDKGAAPGKATGAPTTP